MVKRFTLSDIKPCEMTKGKTNKQTHEQGQGNYWSKYSAEINWYVLTSLKPLFVYYRIEQISKHGETKTLGISFLN